MFRGFHQKNTQFPGRNSPRNSRVWTHLHEHLSPPPFSYRLHLGWICSDSMGGKFLVSEDEGTPAFNIFHVAQTPHCFLVVGHGKIRKYFRSESCLSNVDVSFMIFHPIVGRITQQNKLKTFVPLDLETLCTGPKKLAQILIWLACPGWWRTPLCGMKRAMVFIWDSYPWRIHGTGIFTYIYRRNQVNVYRYNNNNNNIPGPYPICSMGLVCLPTFTIHFM